MLVRKSLPAHIDNNTTVNTEMSEHVSDFPYNIMLNYLEQSARSSFGGIKTGKKLILKIKKTDSLDGTTVLEALSKYKELEPQDKKCLFKGFLQQKVH